MITPDLVKKAVDLIRTRAANYEYFFERLDSPEWIKPLRKEGFFSNPPPPRREAETLSFPFWPEARFLAKVASLDPKTVLEVMLHLPETENVRVHWDLIEAANKLPAAASAKWAAKESAWVEKQPYLDVLVAERLGELVAHLASGGHGREALHLARALLQILPNAKRGEVQIKEKQYFLPHEPRARFDLSIYEEILRKHIPDLIRGCGLDAVSLLCDLLDAAISLPQNAESRSQDFSHIWRPAVEEDAQNQLPSLKSSLVTSLRDGAEQIAEANGDGLTRVIELLRDRRRPWSVFTRIILHLLRSHGRGFPNLVTDYLGNRAIFEDVECRHEYVHLLRERFLSLPSDLRALILSWMEGPSDRIDFAQGLHEWAKALNPANEVSEGDIEQEIQRWKFERLRWLGPELLPEPQKTEFGQLARRFASALEKPADFPHYMQTFVGPTSPASSEQLAAMSREDLMGLLVTWTPSDTFMGGSREGLARELTVLVGREPNRFAAEAERFNQVHPTYVRALINGFRDAVSKHDLEWKAVLALAEWVLEQKDQPLKDEGRYWAEEDRDWSWSRGAIVHLLEVALSQPSVSIPFEYRELVWRLLTRLCQDPNPTREYEAKYGGSNMDPATLSINATRGEAMHAVVHYALWVRKNLDSRGNSNRAFRDMPEVKFVLEEHLDVSKDPSLAIRSVYGRWFPWFHYLDPKWAARKSGDIFPMDPDSRGFWDAAWSTYLAFCNPYDRLLRILLRQYRFSIVMLSEVSKSGHEWYNWTTNLAAHLMAFYWRGRISIRSSDRLIGLFFAKASPKARGYALETVGRWLFNLKEPLDPKIRTRLKRLWSWRVEEIRRRSRPGDEAAELLSFGWWFRSGVFDDAWAIQQLHLALEIASSAAPNVKERQAFPIMERLALISSKRPLDAVQCLETLIAGWKSPWSVSSLHREEVIVILRSALQAEGKTRKKAVEVIDRLAAQGDIEFRHLLSPVKT